MVIVGIALVAAVGLTAAALRRSRSTTSREDLAARAEHHRQGFEPGGAPNQGVWGDHGGAGA